MQNEQEDEGKGAAGFQKQAVNLILCTSLCGSFSFFCAVLFAAVASESCFGITGTGQKQTWPKFLHFGLASGGLCNMHAFLRVVCANTRGLSREQLSVDYSWSPKELFDKPVKTFGNWIHMIRIRFVILSSEKKAHTHACHTFSRKGGMVKTRKRDSFFLISSRLQQ